MNTCEDDLCPCAFRQQGSDEPEWSPVKTAVAMTALILVSWLTIGVGFFVTWRLWLWALS